MHEQPLMPRRRPDLSLRRVVSLLSALGAIGIACGRSTTEPNAQSTVADAACSAAVIHSPYRTFTATWRATYAQR